MDDPGANSARLTAASNRQVVQDVRGDGRPMHCDHADLVSLGGPAS